VVEFVQSVRLPSSINRGILALVVASALVVVLPSALAGAKGVTAKLYLHKTKDGTILVNRHGYTVYAFSKDKPNRDNCVKISGCLMAWPPVTTSGNPIAGPGVKKSLLGTIKLKHGVEQVTYNGYPLYTYFADTRPAETNFINLFQFSGYWPALNAAGKTIK
jgi:predicted lipoprotein with Yx(FWY)xxD motif